MAQTEIVLGEAGASDKVYIPRIRFSSAVSGEYLYGNLMIDCTKYSKLKLTLDTYNANYTFSSNSGYIRIQNGSTTYYDFGAAGNVGLNDGVKEITLDPSWGAEAVLIVYAKSTAQYGRVTYTDFTLT